MARGIEELAEMQVTGPVQGGDMVMKPDQAPVGAAALLSKMAKKNTPGIFKLPMPDKEMPGFMKVAAEGVEQQISQGGDTISTMAGELLRQGFDPIMIKGMDPLSIQILYERTFGSERDADELSSAVQDLRNKVKTVETFAPEDHQLAYITPKEGEMLKLLGGSGETNPITGIKQYPEISRTQAEEKYGVSPSQWSQGFGAGETVTGGGMQDQGSAMESLQESIAAVTPQQARESYQDTQNIYDQLAAGHSSEAINEARRAGVELPETPEKDNMLSKALNVLGIASPFAKIDALSETLANLEEKQVQDLISKIGTGDASPGWGNLLYDFKKDPDRAEKWFEDWEDELGDDDQESETKWKEMSTKEKTDELIRLASAGGGDKFMKHYDPDTYYKDPKNWDAKEMAQAQKEGKLKFTRDNTAMIEEGRKRLEQEAGLDRHPGGRTIKPTEKIIEGEEEVTSMTDPRAGAFNVGGTMPYTEDIRTAGVEMDVPLGRRFDIDKTGKYRGTTGGMDLNEAMNYATLGGYQQLEPFQEYLTRRRKHLGEDEPVYFDEEGNVIYSEVT